MSKGSGSRPLSVPFDEYAEKRKAIFGEPVRVRWVPPPLPEIEPGKTIAWLAEKPQEASRPNPTRMWLLDAQGNSVETETAEAIRLGTVGSTTSHSKVFGKPQEALSAPAYGLDEGKPKAK